MRGLIPYANILLATILLYGLPGRAGAQVTCTPVFTNEYKANSNILPTAVKTLADGTMLTAGKGFAGASTNYDGFVARLNPDGTQIWAYFIGGNGDDVFSGIAALNDGTAIVYGSTKSFGHPEGQGWLVHIDGAGAVLASFVLGSAATLNNWVRAVQQYTDGDIFGSFNVYDGMGGSDPVVFKMGLNGTLRWTHRFDNGNEDNFTSVAFSGDTLYAAGYEVCQGCGFKQAVITLLNITDGSYLSSSTFPYQGNADDEQVTGLQIYGGTISYGLYISGSNNGLGGVLLGNQILLFQTDLAGNLRFPPAYASDGSSGLGQSTLMEPVRTADSGFFVLLTGVGNNVAPGVAKINKYGVEEWGLVLTPGDDNSVMEGIDVTSDGGCVVAGWFNSAVAGNSYILRLVKMTSWGEVSSCNLPQEALTTGTANYQLVPFTWASQPAISPLVQAVAVDPPVPASMSLLNDPENPNCSGSVCLDHTPVPAGCNKTYNIAYATDRSSKLYDVMPTTDGGRLAAGSLVIPSDSLAADVDGLVIKYQSSGDVAWAKNYNLQAGLNLSFKRLVRLADGNTLAIGNDVRGGDTAFWYIVFVKLDNSGNILWVKTIHGPQLTDIGATPDGGFILLAGFTVIRYDGNANIIWQRIATHQVDSSIYLSVSCSGNYIDVAFRSGVFTNQFGVDRLSMQTGAQVWSKAYQTASTAAEVNKIISIRDSVYLFLYNYIQNAGVPITNLVIKLDTLGNFYQAQTLGASDALNMTLYPPTEITVLPPPTVTLSSDGNFVVTGPISSAGSNSLLLTKLRPDGTVIWSHDFASIRYFPDNLRTQGKGFIIPGAESYQHTGEPVFTNGIVLKMDSAGQLEGGAAACQATPHSFVVSPYTAVSPVSNPVSSDLPAALAMVNASMYTQVVAISPILLCAAPGTCNAVNMLQKGVSCAVGDTLVYYLDHSGNCAAAATWNYDSSFFQPGLILGDSIQLIVRQGGSTTVGAQVEGFCSLTEESVGTSIVVTAGGLSFGPDTVLCDNSSVTLVASPGYTGYLWNGNSTGTSLVVTVPGKYFVTATDQCGVGHSDTVLVVAADSLFQLTPPDTVSCNQDTVLLQASNGYADYQWSPAYNVLAQGNEALVTPGVTTRYTVVAQRRPGCMVTRSVLITALSSPGISLGGDTSICSGDSVVLDAGGFFNSYLWSTGDTSERIYVSQAGAYSVAALYNNGCMSRDSFLLVGLYKIVRPPLDSIFCLGTDRVLNAGPGYSTYLWNTGSTGSSVDVGQPGVYWVVVTDAHGCRTTDSTVATGKECLVGLYVPNAFTPNGDGHNDRCRPVFYGVAVHFEFAVFDRWGQRVFETESPRTDGWDGTIGGVRAPAGVYVWYCRYQYSGRPEAMQKGTVMLIR